MSVKNIISWLEKELFGFALFTANPATLTDGDTTPLLCDNSGRLLVNPAGSPTSWVDAGAAGAERVISTTNKKLYQLWGRNCGTTTKWIFIFDLAALGGSRPANGTHTELFIPIAVEANSEFSIDLEVPRTFTNGIAVSTSSTDITFTYDSTGSFLFCAEVGA